MSDWKQFCLLFRVYRRIFRARVKKLVTESKFMTFVLTVFLVTYMVAGYELFSHGLAYVNRLPAVSSLISERLLYLIFFCFFLMLIFSAAVTSFIALFRNRETKWLLTLPLSHRVIFLWKSLESALFSSWGLLFISAPLIVAFANQREVSPTFYLKTLVVLFPFIMVASAIASLLLLAVVRWVSKRQFIIAAAAATLVLTIFTVRTVAADRNLVEETGLSAALTFQQVLRHTEVSENLLSPSTWLTRSILQWTRPLYGSSPLFPLLLISYALMGLLLVTWTARHWFYDAWNRTLQGNAISVLRRESRLAEAAARLHERAETVRDRFFKSPLLAICRKDIATFFREPAQWVQFLIVFGLLVFYVLNIDKMGYDIDQLHDPEDEVSTARDRYIIAYLNLTVCSLALSTLTTRFVFPQFSLEGRRVWILAMSPMPLERLVWQKFFLSTAFTGSLMFALVFLSGHMLRLERGETLFFAGAIILLSVGLNGIATGLGVIFPNLREVNAAKIVSGFGGTLCLITSFVYIMAFIGSLIYARKVYWVSNGARVPQIFQDPHWNLGVTAALGATVLAAAVPLFFARTRLKKLEILGNL